jgi:hypothetical protein
LLGRDEHQAKLNIAEGYYTCAVACKTLLKTLFKFTFPQTVGVDLVTVMQTGLGADYVRGQIIPTTLDQYFDFTILDEMVRASGIINAIFDNPHNIEHAYKMTDIDPTKDTNNTELRTLLTDNRNWRYYYFWFRYYMKGVFSPNKVHNNSLLTPNKLNMIQLMAYYMRESWEKRAIDHVKAQSTTSRKEREQAAEEEEDARRHAARNKAHRRQADSARSYYQDPYNRRFGGGRLQRKISISKTKRHSRRK